MPFLVNNILWPLTAKLLLKATKFPNYFQTFLVNWFLQTNNAGLYGLNVLWDIVNGRGLSLNFTLLFGFFKMLFILNHNSCFLGIIKKILIFTLTEWTDSGNFPRFEKKLTPP